MLFERTHELFIAHAKLSNGNSKNNYRIVYGEDMLKFRELDLKLQHVSDNHGTTFKRALKS